LRPEDDVAVALDALSAGELLDNGIVLASDVPRGHKFALRALEPGAGIVKLGRVIGAAAVGLAAGEHVHVHNIDTSAVPRATAPAPAAGADMPERTTFHGIRRADGSVGTRNCIGVIATVNCSATVVREIVQKARIDLLPAYPGIDAIVPITHTTGCGMSSRGAGMDLLQRTLGGFMRHPNFGGVLLIGLGCEANDIEALLASQGQTNRPGLRTLSIQSAGGTRAAIAAGLQHVQSLAAAAAGAKREPVPVSALTLGLQCGGSDAFSAVSANPALGYAADLLVRAGGTVILAETPEIHGAEELLLSRAADAAVAAALEAKLDWWQAYVALHGESLNNNPSPGNIAGGISTIYEKSLGAVAKAGTSRLEGVFDYGQRIDRHGFVFMDSPGYDPCSVTGEIAAGANIVCFTTGRGSVFGAKPVPAVKLATNSEMAKHMADDMDFDCGRILTGDISLAAAGKAIYELLLDVASGTSSASERNGLGDFEFVPWQLGAVL
jgi:altronate hydrolase